MPKPICLSLPYSDMEEITKDIQSALIISQAYASSHSELGTILQYVYHSMNLSCQGYSEIASVLEGISICEMKHLKILGTLLYKLGVDPIFTSNPPLNYGFFTTSSISYSKTPQKIIMDSISGEMLAIKDYSEIEKRLSNEKVAAIIARIRLDEELHVKVLKEQLDNLFANKND